MVVRERVQGWMDGWVVVVVVRQGVQGWGWMGGGGVWGHR